MSIAILSAECSRVPTNLCFATCFPRAATAGGTVSCNGFVRVAVVMNNNARDYALQAASRFQQLLTRRTS